MKNEKRVVSSLRLTHCVQLRVGLILLVIASTCGCSENSAREPEQDQEVNDYTILESFPCSDGGPWIVRIVPEFETVYYKPDHLLILCSTPDWRMSSNGKDVLLGKLARRDKIDVTNVGERHVIVTIRNPLNRDVPIPPNYDSAELAVEVVFRE